MVSRRQLPFRKAQKRLVFVESELQAFISALPGVTLDELRERVRART
jgi:hypothetical protein